LAEGRSWEERVTQKLSSVVFDKLFSTLLNALYKNDPQAPKLPLTDQYLNELKEAGLILLYRILFVLYAEDRNLLPTKTEGYRNYSLHKIREEIANHVTRRVEFSDLASKYYNSMQNDLFRIINQGDSSLNVPPYNGGLFDPEQHQLLKRTELSDTIFVPLLDSLSRTVLDSLSRTDRKWINYRDLSVQHLGSIYERLLEIEPYLNNDNIIKTRFNVYARKDSGSYYTPEELVRLIIERTIEPLLEEIKNTFIKQVKQLKDNNCLQTDQLEELKVFDPASAMLKLCICDPAMGSGHFLVSLVDYLADNILEAIAKAESIVKEIDENINYQSPLIQRIETLREQILNKAKTNKWEIQREHLDDRLLVRRIILRRVIYGIDINPMAVELAKVSLWLHTFTVGAPLSFLDHHLVCGNALFGEWVNLVEKELTTSNFSLFINPYIQQAMQTARAM